MNEFREVNEDEFEYMGRPMTFEEHEAYWKEVEGDEGYWKSFDSSFPYKPEPYEYWDSEPVDWPPDDADGEI